MVYRVSKVGNSTTTKTVLISFFSKWVTYALIFYIICSIDDQSPAAPYMWWWMLGLAIPAAIVAAVHARRLRQNTKSYENTFYTLTDGGVLIESDSGATAAYIAWDEITMARRVLNHTIYLEHSSGKGLNCLLEGLPEERIAEFAAFAEEHAGTTPAPSQLTPPPAELAETTPLTFSATPEQRQVLADTRVLLQAPAWVWTWLRPVLLLLWGIVLLAASYEATYLYMLIVGFIVWRAANKLRHPGGAAENLRHIRPAQCYVLHNKLLFISENSNSWLMSSQAQPRTVYNVPHGVCIENKDGVIMVDPAQTLPPHMNTCSKQLPKRLPSKAISVLLGAILLGAVWCFTQSNTWRLHQLLQQEEIDIPEALSLAELPRSTKVTRAGAHTADESVSILYHTGSEQSTYAAFLYFELEDADCIACFNQYGELVTRETIPNHSEGDAEEYEEEEQQE